ncbi:MAG: OmpA family protein [Tenuifilaceae bacterium]|jgi:outer membrane protein OmpA-like peptidoglycan-associated protein|nr:OmpA family protein [Tenuifilaceae bacterium]
MSLRKLYKNFIFWLLVTVFPFTGTAQYYFYNNEPSKLEISFAKHYVTSSAKETFFNALKIKNGGNRTESVTLNITVPQGWNVIGQDKSELTIEPNDSIFIPTRIGVGSQARGDIGYSVIASLTDSRGNTIKNEYCFVKIPRISGFRIKNIDRFRFIDPEKNTANFSLSLGNKGNRQELISIIMEAEQDISIEGGTNTFVKDVTLKEYNDTTVTFNVRLVNTISFGKNMYKLNLRVSSQDTSFQQNVWFKKLESDYINYIPPTTKPLVLEVTALGLLKENEIPNITALAEGSIFFREKKSIYFHYRNYTSHNEEDLYKYNRMYIGATINGFTLEIGDSYRSSETSLLGRGAYLEYSKKKYSAFVLVNKDLRISTYNYSGRLRFHPKQSLYFETEYILNKKDDANSLTSHMAIGRTSFSLGKGHSLGLMGAYNTYQKDINGKTTHTGFGAQLSYNLNHKQLSGSVRAKYGSPTYMGNYKGRFDGTLFLNYNLNTGNNIQLQYSEYRFTNINEQTNSSVSTISRVSTLDYLRALSPRILLIAGPGADHYFWENLAGYNQATPFNAITPKFSIGTRFRIGGGYTILTPKVTIGFPKIIEAPLREGETDNGLRKNQFNYKEVSLNLRSSKIGLISSYISGPKTVFELINHYYTSRPFNYIRIMPSYDSYIYKNIIELNASLSYNNDLVSKSSYTNISAQLQWHLKNDWLVRALGVYSLQNRKDQNEATQSYQTFYLEAGIRKEFNLNHPSVKYHDIELVFFKDFNGNSTQDQNEPGIKNILVEINKIEGVEAKYVPGDFYSTQLLSNAYGRVTLENIPEGNYTINYYAVGDDAGTFSKANEESNLKVSFTGNYYFPYVEKNKVFGKIILNRSKLSGLGNIDVSNVRIVATDSQKRSYSTLTDKNGEFVLFAPVTDRYSVSINNIFYENFDLRQNNFMVQFNGYKQFEVNFVFDEKVRRINFAQGFENQPEGVAQVRRTNIRGTVKDANTLNPIRARVSLVNTTDNTTITSVYSNAQSGDFGFSFLAGDNYAVEVVAEGYWYMSENLNLNQVTTFMNVTRDVMLKPIAVGSQIGLNIPFGSNSAELGPEAVAELNRLLTLLRDNPTVRIEIQGHSDDLEALSNTSISEERAKSVARYLIEKGYSNLTTKGMGNTTPKVSNDTEQGRAQNRRVEVEVLSR